jgi:hypothetical protein
MRGEGRGVGEWGGKEEEERKKEGQVGQEKSRREVADCLVERIWTEDL